MKPLPKIVFILYLVVLAWLVLFKFSFDIPMVLSHNMRSLNFIPFVGNNPGEMLDNLIVFIPFGILLSANFKQISLWQKLSSVFAFSLAAETLQFVFAIGRTDISDIIMNTLGGLVGLLFYRLTSHYANEEKLDLCISIIIATLLAAIVLLRTLVFRVRY